LNLLADSENDENCIDTLSSDNFVITKRTHNISTDFRNFWFMYTLEIRRVSQLHAARPPKMVLELHCLVEHFICVH